MLENIFYKYATISHIEGLPAMGIPATLGLSPDPFIFLPECTIPQRLWIQCTYPVFLYMMSKNNIPQRLSYTGRYSILHMEYD